MSNRPAPFAEARVDAMLAKLFAFCAVLLSIDLISNALAQRQQLNQVWFWLTFGVVIAAQLGTVVGAFFLGNMKFWYRSLTLATLFTLITWPLQVGAKAALEANFKPWIWWAVGFSALAAAGAFRTSLALVILIFMPAIWLLIRTSPSGGSVEFAAAAEDALYSMFFSTSIALLVMVLRRTVSNVDEAHQEKIAAAVQLATARAIDRERVRISSIAHDKVLSSLALAVHASSESQRQLAATAATEAIARLERESARRPDSEAPVSTEVFANALGDMVESQAHGFEYKTKMLHESFLPFDQLVAIAEAVVQAALNSLEHSASMHRVVTLSNTASKLKVVVEDDGVGFRVSSLARNNLGVRLAIQRRLKAFNVDVNLNTKRGTTWIFEVKHSA